MRIKLLKLTPLIGIGFLIFFGCAPSSMVNYQVVSVEAPSLEKTQDGIEYENSDLVLRYDLWSNHGNLKYDVVNKSDQMLHINLQESFFIKDGVSYTYFPNQTHSLSPDFYLNSAKRRAPDTIAKNRVLTRKMFQSQKVITVPPQSRKEIMSFNLKKEKFKSCDLTEYPTREDTSEVMFNENNSPMTFENYLAYRVGEKDNAMQSVRNNFYVNKIQNLDEYNFYTEKEKEKPCEPEETETERVVPEENEHKFYIKYWENQPGDDIVNDATGL